LTIGGFVLKFKKINLIESDGGNWPEEVQQPVFYYKVLNPTKCETILEDKVIMFT
jgi:hypothetical protein